MKLALVAPAATVTIAGVVAAAESSERVTTVPPEGAAALRVTVPVEELPPVTVVGLRASALSAGALVMPRLANWVVLPSVAESCTVVLSTGNVVIVKVALVAPAGTVTVAGTLAEPGRLLPRLTATPPLGAALPSVTVPVALVPPATLVGLTVSAVSAGRFDDTVRSAVRVTPPPVTEIVTTVGASTGLVVMLNRPKSVEALIVANSGTWATPGLLLVTRTS